MRTLVVAELLGESMPVLLAMRRLQAPELTT